MGGAKWAGRVEKGGILLAVVFRFALLYLAQPATIVRTASLLVSRRPSALCWRVGIALLLLVLAALLIAFLLQLCVSIAQYDSDKRVFCSNAALSWMLVVRSDGACLLQKPARYVALHCRGTIPQAALALTQQ